MKFLNIVPAARIHIYSKSELIFVIVSLAVYFIVNLLLQKFKPEMEQKKINTISLVVAVVVIVICIFVL